MTGPSSLYGQSLGLLTDLYELTMASGFVSLGRTRDEAVFHLSFREPPFKGGYTIACGLEPAIDFLRALRFTEDDLAYLAQLTGNDGRALFPPVFLDYLRGFRFTGDVDAVPEGTVVFPHQPLVRVRGPLPECQIVESALLNIVGFQTLVATKAARIASAARGRPVVEFGLRRAQGVDGAVAASRAAFVGGCAGTSNVLAGKLFGIPVKGTHAHSWVMSFDTEEEAFAAYARALPNNVTFLVDTYDTIRGVRNAIDAGRRLRALGHEMIGVRLDSGDLAYLSNAARRMLDEAGFADAVVFGSGDLDEQIIDSLEQQEATIAAFGVGTRLVTGEGQPSLGAVYKLSAVRRGGGPWEYKVKVSEQSVKATTPGILQVRRYADGGSFVADVMYDEELLGPPVEGQPAVVVDLADPTRRKLVAAGTPHEELLVPVFRAGDVVYEPPPIRALQERARAQLGSLHPAVRRFLNPHEYPAGLEPRLLALRTEMILKTREAALAGRHEPPPGAEDPS